LMTRSKLSSNIRLAKHRRKRVSKAN
jgi:hypothetical protein